MLDSIKKQRVVCKQLLQNAKAPKPPIHEDVIAWEGPKSLEVFSLKLSNVAEANAEAHTRLKPYGYQEHNNGANKEKMKHDRSDATKREQKKSRQDSSKQSTADCNHCG